MPPAQYLGDGLYASYDGYQIKLMANDHKHPSDTVYLDPVVYAALLRFVESINQQEGKPAEIVQIGA